MEQRQPLSHVSRRPVVRRSRRAGFSLIEILIVIAVIMVLLGIGIYGYRAMEESAAKKQTMAALASADGLLKEMNSTGSYSRVEGAKDLVPEPFYEQGFALGNPGDVNVTKPGRATIVNNDTTMNTPSQPRLMRVFRANTKIAAMISALPSQSLLPADPGQPARTEPILADAWGNPLLLVPSGGLQGVNMTEAGSNNQKITTSGQASSPANRAFWASAGPDGNFSTGDDNLYSFQK